MPIKMTDNEQYQIGDIHRLIGKMVVNVAVDRDGVGALMFDDGTIAWITCDPEGNGPGHLDIVEPKKGGR